MKIAIISPLSYPVPPERYGGIELVIYYLAQGLKKKGHDVTLFAAEGSDVDVQIDPKFSHQIIGDSMNEVNLSYASQRIDYIASISDQFDIIHNNDGYLALKYAEKFKCPLVTTWHTPIKKPEELQSWEADLLRKANLITISLAQRRNFPDANYVANIYNGTVDFNEYRFGEGGEDLIWFGRLDAVKGAKDAIVAANELKIKLILAGKVESDAQKEYFDNFIKPYVDGKNIIFLGQINLEEKVKWLRQSKAFVMPVNFEEPFGLVLIESMACGTPVVAFARGSIPEVIRDGVTGFIVNSSDDDIRGDFIITKTGMDGFKEALERIYSMSETEQKQMRLNCRRHVEENFSIMRMVDGYETVFKKQILPLIDK